MKEKVTLRRLLSHSAGFTDDYGFAGYRVTDPIPSLINIIQAQPPANNKKALTVDYVPGSQARYSGGGYLVIQQLIPCESLYLLEKCQAKALIRRSDPGV